MVKLVNIFSLVLMYSISAQGSAERRTNIATIKERGIRRGLVKTKVPIEAERKKATPIKKPKRPRLENERRKFVSNNLKGLVIYPDKDSTLNLTKTYVGDELDVVLTKDMIGYGNSKRSVVAKVRTGHLKGWKVLGNVSMDLKTKELLVDFNQLRDPQGQKLHKFKAELRLKGRHESKFWNYFWASVGANMVGGLAESSKQQERTIYGSQPTISPENLVKGSIAEGAESASNLLIKELKNYPEFTVVMGPVFEKAVVSVEPELIR